LFEKVRAAAMAFNVNEHAHCFASRPGEAYFWHGRTTDSESGKVYGGEFNAARIAKEKGGTTLEMCMLANREELEKAGVRFKDRYDEAGNLFTTISYGDTPAEAGDFWEACSESFAKQASAPVYVITGTDPRPEGAPKSVFLTRELGVLLRKGIDPIPIDAINGKPIIKKEKPKEETKDQDKKSTKNGGSSQTASIIKAQGGESGMKLIDVGKITISPFEFDSITEIKIEKGLNEHSTLYASGIVCDDKLFTPATDKTADIKVKCENDGQAYFSGVLRSVKVTCVNAVYRLEIFAISNTILLDTVKHKRSFQDNGEKYQAIIEKVIADNSGVVKYHADASTVENIILQYNETDWEFAKRLASHTNDVLIPIVDDNPAFHLGVPSGGGAKLESKDYSISRNFDAIRWFDAPGIVEKEKNGSPLELTADDVTLYSVETDDFVCDIGEKLNLNGVDLHACRISLTFVNSALTIAYTLCGEKAVSAPKFYNCAITGLILDGKVTEVKKDTLKLDLSNDKGRDADLADAYKGAGRGVEEDTGEKHFFKYATGYSMEKHTGWYVMPEPDDIVQLLFPAEDEKYAYATSSIRQGDTDKTADYMVKYWRTSYGKEIKMEEKEILITGKDGETFVRINEDSGIEINTKKDVKINCEGKMDINSDKDMTITSGANLTITATNSLKTICSSSSTVMDGDIHMDAKNIYQNA